MKRERYDDIAARIAELPSDSKESVGYEVLYGNQTSARLVEAAHQLLRVAGFNFEDVGELFAAMSGIPERELVNMTAAQMHDRLYPDHVTRSEFRDVWLSERAEKHPPTDE